MPLVELQKLGKTCPADETLELEVLSARTGCCCATASAAIRSNRSSPRPRLRTSRSRRRSPRSSVSLDEAARDATLLEALACASDDETRVILNGAYLDVSKPTGHYAVATDGRHLFASNSLHLALPSSVLIPDHRFLSWSGFVKGWTVEARRAAADEGEGRLPPSGKPPLDVCHQADRGKRIPTGVTSPTMCASSRAPSRSASRRRKPSARIVPRLPGDDTPNHTVGLYTCVGQVLPARHQQGPGACPRKWKCPASR